MSYRDDTDALLTRATALQAEVDRLEAELAQRPPRPTWPAYRAREAEEAAEAKARDARDALPSTPALRVAPSPMPRPWAAVTNADDRPDDPLAMLNDLRDPDDATRAPPALATVVAGLGRDERDLVLRLVELLAGGDGGAAVTHHRLVVFDHLVGTLRARLAE